MMSSGSTRTKGSSPIVRRADITAWAIPPSDAVGQCDLGHLPRPLHALEALRIRLRLERCFEIGDAPEVVLDGALATRGHHHDVLDSRIHQLFDDVMDDGRIDEGKELFWYRLS